MRISYIGAFLFGLGISMLLPPTNDDLRLLFVVIISLGLLMIAIDLFIVFRKNKKECVKQGLQE